MRAVQGNFGVGRTNGGDAVHGYPRASYGFPQSNGCVELPIETAHRVFDRLAIGDVVWVQ